MSSIAYRCHEAPSGGVKVSGHGSESGIDSMDAFLDTRFPHDVA